MGFRTVVLPPFSRCTKHLLLGWPEFSGTRWICHIFGHILKVFFQSCDTKSHRFPRNGKYVLSSGKDSLVKLWELSTSRCLIAYTGAGSTGKQVDKTIELVLTLEILVTHVLSCRSTRPRQCSTRRRTMLCSPTRRPPPFVCGTVGMQAGNSFYPLDTMDR